MAGVVHVELDDGYVPVREDVQDLVSHSRHRAQECGDGVDEGGFALDHVRVADAQLHVVAHECGQFRDVLASKVADGATGGATAPQGMSPQVHATRELPGGLWRVGPALLDAPRSARREFACAVEAVEERAEYAVVERRREKDQARPGRAGRAARIAGPLLHR
jgi:hypothetical protein